MALADLIAQGSLWRGSEEAAAHTGDVEPSGYPELDALLAGGGWFKGQLIELLYAAEGCGELRLLWPLLQRYQKPDGLVIWVDPPFQPYPLALIQAGISLSSQRVVRTGSMKERLWATEQALKSGCAPLVLSWLGPQVPTAALRRLQLAVQEGGGLGWMMRPEQVREQPSPAGYRLHLRPGLAAAELTLLKRRGGWPLPPTELELPAVV